MNARTVAVLSVVLTAGCANQARLTVITEPAGGYVSQQGGGPALGTAPAVIAYEPRQLEAFRDSAGCYLVRGVEVTWVSGAMARSEPSIRLCGSSTGSYTYRLARDPGHPNLDRDLQFAAQLAGIASQRAQADAAGMAAAAALLQATRPQQAAPASGQPAAFFRRDYVSGFNRVCVYDRLGSEYVITIPAMNICPLQAP